jgi:chromosomal replication initiator protein
MAHEVNQSEKEVAAQVRSALVARISHERCELWLPGDCQWQWDGQQLTLSFSNEFACQMAHRMLLADLRAVLNEVVGPHAGLHLRMSSASPTAAAQAVAPPQPDDNLSDSPSAEGPTDQSATEANSPRVSQTALNIARGLPPARPSDAAPAPGLRRVSGEAAPVRASQPTLRIADPTPSAAEPVRRAQDAWQEFICGASNQLAWTTVNLILQNPGQLSPVLIYGPFGVGKSHLAAGLAQQLRTAKRQRRVLHITAEQFTNDFTEAIRGGGLPLLRRKYRDVDTLILDDLQFLIGKKATVNELRHTLDNLLKAGRQVVLLADRSLNELEALGSEFTTRLRGGLVAPLMPLDEDTRVSLLQRELAQSRVEISDDMLRQIAARTVGDGRLLKGIAKRLIANAFVHAEKLTWDQCWNAIFDLIQATQPVVRLGDIERVVCEVFGLEPESLQSERKTRNVSQPRMLAMFLARKYTPAAYKEIGDFFGHRRHSTVISAEKTVESWLEENTTLQVARGALAIRDAMRHVEATLQVG